MQRRSFIQSLLAIPVVAAVAKLVPAQPKSLPDPSNPFPVDPWTAYRRAPKFAQYRAAVGIRKGSLVREFQFGEGVVPVDNEPGGWFVGVAMHDAMEGDMVKVMTEGTTSVRFQ